MAAKCCYMVFLLLIIFNLSSCSTSKIQPHEKKKNYTNLLGLTDDNIDSVILKYDKKSYQIYNNFHYTEFLSDIIIDNQSIDNHLGMLELFLADNKLYFFKFTSYNNDYNIIWKDKKKWKKYKKYWD